MDIISKHLEELYASGLDGQTIKQAGIYSASPQEVSAILGVPYDCGGIVFPYRNLGEIGGMGEVNRIKLDKEVCGSKYRTKSGEVNHLYLTHLTPDFLQDTAKSIAFTEGEKKALKATQDFMPTVGLSGVWSWKTKDENDQSVPVEDLNLINFSNRSVDIFFDSDAACNSQVRMAEMSFAYECKKRGASLIKAYRFPHGKDGSKVGIDDFLLKHSPAELKQLPVVDPVTCYKIVEAIKNGGNTKKDQIVDAIVKGLISWGYFIHSQDGDLFYFDRLHYKMYSIGSDDFKSLLSFRYQINAQETAFKFLVEKVKSLAYESGQRVQIYRFSHYDEKKNKLYVYNNNHKIYRLDGNSIEILNNGDDEVLFCHNPIHEPIDCNIPNKYNGLCDTFIFKYANLDETSIPKEEQIFILRMWLWSLFFPELLPTRVILLCCGPKGSSKTTLLQLIGRLLFGQNFNVTSIDKEDAFIASICGNYFVAFDNVDGKVEWLQNNLARIATGQHIPRRKLYTTNDEIVYKPNIYIALTSRTPKFKRDDVVDRLLLLQTITLESNKPYKFLINQVEEHRQEMWADILYQLNSIIKQLPNTPSPEIVNHRMADFAVFCLRIAEILGCKEPCEQALEKMRNVNKEFMFDGDPLPDCLLKWLSEKSNIGREISAAPLLVELKTIAGPESGLDYPSAISFGKRIDNIKTDSEDELNIRIFVRKAHGKNFYRFIIKDTKPTSSNSLAQDDLPF